MADLIHIVIPWRGFCFFAKFAKSVSTESHKILRYCFAVRRITR
jgi:hypothetical protein